MAEFQHSAARRRLVVQVVRLLYPVGFQHTAAQRQLVGDKYGIDPDMLVSRHSRLKAADGFIMLTFVMVAVSTHSCTKAAEYIAKHIDSRLPVSTHSRPKAAGAFLKSLAPSGFAAPISLSSREKRERKYNTAFSVTPAFAIS